MDVEEYGDVDVEGIAVGAVVGAVDVGADVEAVVVVCLVCVEFLKIVSVYTAPMWDPAFF